MANSRGVRKRGEQSVTWFRSLIGLERKGSVSHVQGEGVVLLEKQGRMREVADTTLAGLT